MDVRLRMQRRLIRQDIDLGVRSAGKPMTVPLSAFERGALVTGPTGTGKTRCLRRINVEIAEKYPQVAQIIISPKGAYAPELRRDFYRKGWRRRVTYIDLSERRRLPGLNILRPWGCDELQAKTARETLARSMGLSVLSVTPRLARFSYAGLFGVIASRLTMREAAPLLDYNDGGLRAAVIPLLPPGAARQDLEMLEAISVHLRGSRASASQLVSALRVFDELTGSSLNRLRLINENPVLRLVLGTKRSIDWNNIVQPGRLTIFNFALGETLDAEDQRHLVMAAIADIKRTCFSRPPGRLVRVILTIDEVGRFPTPVLEEINDQGREHGLSVIGSHQFLSQLENPKEHDRRLLDSFLADTDLKICFGSLPPRDARELAEVFYGHHLDPDKVHHELKTTRQLSQVVTASSRTSGKSEQRTRSRSEMTAVSDTESRMVSQTSADGDTSGETDSLAHALGHSQGATGSSSAGGAEIQTSGLTTSDGFLVAPNGQVDGMSHNGGVSDVLSRVESEMAAEGWNDSSSTVDVEGHAASYAQSHVEAETIAEGTARSWTGAESTSEGRTDGSSESSTEGPMVVPTEPFLETSSVQFEPLETQLHRVMAAMIKQPDRHALLVVGKEPPVTFCVAEVPDPPISERQALMVDLDMMGDRAEIFSTPEEIEAEVSERHRLLLSGKRAGHQERSYALPSRAEMDALFADVPVDVRAVVGSGVSKPKRSRGRSLDSAA